ncbi:hypothetical protein OG787_21360 [Streptomyces sp. NBC_00075]|uniref:hypothetical protein n=1 Tax=Streptomyces sp. NBC_00075 TaxID=2975641 RepID=UPI0032557260
MDPIAPELLMALAGGTAGAAGQQIWASSRDLVRRRPPAGEPRGEGELVSLGEASDSPTRARQLADVLALRVQQDPACAQALDTWRREAEALDGTPTGVGDIHNEISGGTFQGPVIQARDINGPLHFGS